jgi:hypothetical protein
MTPTPTPTPNSSEKVRDEEKVSRKKKGDQNKERQEKYFRMHVPSFLVGCTFGTSSYLREYTYDLRE